MVLGQAARQLIAKRLLVIGDGTLQYVPFASLPDPSAKSAEPGAVKSIKASRAVESRRAKTFTPLVLNHELVSLPSASTLAVFADPVFTRDDGRGTPQDGYLRVHDIFNLQLPAELIVLSACRTGLGREIKGEGLVGLTRAFMYAGAARMVASLWSVNDKATAELMRRFYRRMLGPERQTAAAALRAAQIEMWRTCVGNRPTSGPASLFKVSGGRAVL
jgi:hypothetical protein